MLIWLQAVDDSILVHQFSSLSAREHHRHMRSTQVIENQSVASVERIVRNTPGGDAEVIAETWLGNFEQGFINRFSSIPDPSNLAASIIEDNPQYLSARFAEDYTFRVLPDTLLGHKSVQVVSIEALEGTDQPIRKAVYYIDQNTVVALLLEHTRRTLFFTEASHYYLEMRANNGQSWAPHHIYISTRLALPLRPRRTLTRSATFFKIQDLET